MFLKVFYFNIYPDFINTYTNIFCEIRNYNNAKINEVLKRDFPIAIKMALSQKW